MNLSVIISVFLLAVLNLSIVSSGWRGPSNRWTPSQQGQHAINRRTRLRPPLNHQRTRARPNAGIQRRTSGANKDMVHFYLYPDPKDTTYKEEIVVGNNVSLSSYKPDYSPILIIHDYMQNYSNVYPQRTKDAYLRQNFIANVIIADWKGLSQPSYGLINNIALGFPKASKRVSKMGRQISDFLMFLMTQRVLKDPESIHLIGFGLGAQIAGVAGNNFKRGSGMQLGRITGLDPSGLQYHYTAMSEKLDKSDALFVDVIHTTSSPFGFGSSVGSVDFYPNGGGPSQPGCKSLLDMMKDIPGMEGSCAHTRAWEYFTDSIYNKKIYACQSSSFLMYKMKSFCSKAVVFGQHISTKAQGDYFLELFHKD